MSYFPEKFSDRRVYYVYDREGIFVGSLESSEDASSDEKITVDEKAHNLILAGYDVRRIS